MTKLLEKVGETKKIILEACLTPKHWSDLLNITQRSEPTLHVHVNDLIKLRLIEKDETNRTYITTERGVDFLKLEPHVRQLPQNNRSPELKKLVSRGIKPISFTLKENIKYEFLGLEAIAHDKTLKKVHEDVIQAIRQSVTVWLPQGYVPDKSTYDMVNKIIGKYVKDNPTQPIGKVSMIIEFDLPTALDMVIREESDPTIKLKLENEKEMVLKRIYRNWYNIFNRII